MLKAGGFGFIRMDFIWASTETQRGVYDFSQYDILMSNLNSVGIRALFILDYSNSLYDDGKPVYDDIGRTAMANWAANATVHFKGQGILWEMWNEPNGAWFWPNPNATAYALMANCVGKAIKAATPNEAFIGPALSGFDQSYFITTFQNGVLEYFDAVTVHPYRGNNPETVISDWQWLASAVKQYAPSGKTIPLISSEWGYSSIGSFTTIDQAQYIVRSWLINMYMDCPVTIWYDWHDDCSNDSYDECLFGTVDYTYYPGHNPVYTPKYAYFAAQTLTKCLNGYSISSRVNAGNAANDYILQFTNSASKIAYAAWTTGNNDTVSFSVSGCFNVMTIYGSYIANLCPGSNGQVSLNLSDNIQYLIPK